MIKRLLTICLTFAVISGMAGEMDAYHFTGKSKKSGNNPRGFAFKTI